MSDEELPGIVDGGQSRLVVYEHRCGSPRRQCDGPTLQFTRDEERACGLALREAIKTARSHVHRAMRLSNDFHSFTILIIQKVAETYEVCKISRTSGDVSIIARCEGADGSAGMPCLVMSRFFYAEGPQRADCKWVIFIHIVKKVFELRGKIWALSPPRK
jgi:hypothetical protein